MFQSFAPVDNFHIGSCSFFFFSSRRRHTRYWRDWSSDVCSSDLIAAMVAFTRDVLLAHGVPDADAALAARQMIEADLTGFDAHGIVRLGNYCNWIKSGRVNAKAQIKVLQRSPATALVDGDDGIGHLVMTYAMNLAIELGRQSGVGWVGARHS